MTLTTAMVVARRLGEIRFTLSTNDNATVAGGPCWVNVAGADCADPSTLLIDAVIDCVPEVVPGVIVTPHTPLLFVTQVGFEKWASPVAAKVTVVLPHATPQRFSVAVAMLVPPDVFMAVGLSVRVTTKPPDAAAGGVDEKRDANRTIGATTFIARRVRRCVAIVAPKFFSGVGSVEPSCSPLP